jgi:mannose-1-phosphate guanylyltransferase
MKVVIRAGGIGTRLWPMSRTDNPKQFQKLIGDKSMIRTTFDRISPHLVGIDDIFVSVNHTLSEKLKEQMPELKPRNVIVETDTRNTGPAMCLEACYLNKIFDRHTIIASLPSDDYISDSAAFRDLLRLAEEFIKLNPDYILTPGIKPTYIDTGYTYLKAGNNLQEIGEEAIYEVIDVIEKPDYDYCEDLIKSGIYYCHTGMYIWQLGTVLDLWKEHQPNMLSTCQEIADIMHGSKPIKEARELYSQLEMMSVESAITHHAEKIAMSVSNRLGWSDLGKWHVIKKVLDPTEVGNVKRGQIFDFRSVNNVIYSNNPKKIVVTNDIKDLAIIDTDDVLFISSLENSPDVKKILEKLKEEGQEKYL